MSLKEDVQNYPEKGDLLVGSINERRI